MKTIVTIDPASKLAEFIATSQNAVDELLEEGIFPVLAEHSAIRVHYPDGQSALPELLDVLISLRSFDRMESEFGCVRFVYKDGSRTTLAAMSIPTIVTGIYMGIVANIAIDTAAADEPAGEAGP